MRAIEVIIFDLGKVILKLTSLSQNPAFLAKCSVPKGEVKEFFDSAVWHRYERGELSTDWFVQFAVSALGYRGTHDEFRRDFCEMLLAELDREVFDIVCALKTHERKPELWLLSNINELHYDYLFAKWPGVFYNFPRVFLSFKMDARKPDEGIFRKALKEGGAHPENCLYFDDVEAFVRAAKKFGIEARQFESSARLKRDLSAAGFKLPKD